MKSKLIAEFLGTFILVFAGTGAVIADGFSGGAVTHPGISLVFGMVVIALIYSLGEVSGAHLNPAVTIGFAFANRFSWKDVPSYAIAQTAGAVLASAVWKVIFPEETGMGATLPHVGIWQSLLLEFILTFILMFVIIHVATGSREQGIMAGMAIGMTVGMEAMFAGPLTGASMNPVRSLAPALFAGGQALESIWIYIAAPVVGAITAVLVFSVMHGNGRD
jgi:aquaporin NIP